MKNETYVLFVWLFFCIANTNAQTQSTEPNKLVNCENLLCNKCDNQIYTGKVEGLLSRGMSLNVANMINFLLSINSPEEGSFDENKEIVFQLYIVGFVENGKEIGRWQYYTTDRVLLLEADFVKGIQDGELLVYYSNKNIKSCSIYKDGRQDGIIVTYDKSGNITGKYICKDNYIIEIIPIERE